MRRLMAIFFAVVLFLMAASAMAQPNEFRTTITATVSNTPVALSFPSQSVLIINDDATNSVHVTVNGSVATTGDQEVKPGESLSLSLFVRTSAIGVIAAAGTAAVRIYAVEGSAAVANLTGGGGGGGGDASAANQATQITALPLEDSASADAQRGTAVMRVRKDTLVADGEVSTDGDYLFSFTDNRGAGWVHNDPVDAQLELHAAASVTGDGTTIDVSGVNMVLVHATASAGWDRSSTISFQGALGGGALSAFRILPYIEFQNATGSATTVPIGRFSTAAVIAAVASTQQGYLVDVRGFQTFKVPIAVLGGTTGTLEVHAHLVKNGEGTFNAAMALVNTTVGLNSIPDFAMLMAGLDPGANLNSQATLPIARTTVDSYASSDRGVPVHFVNNELLTQQMTTADGQYSLGAVDDEGRVLTQLLHNSVFTNANSVSKLEDSAHGSGDPGIPMWGVANTSFSTRAGNNDYVTISTGTDGIQYTYPRYDLGVAAGNQLAKKEDELHSSGDAGVASLGTHNEALATYSGTANDYVPDARERTGVGLRSIIYGNLAAGTQLGKLEDSPSGNGHAGMPAFFVRNDNATNSHGGGNGDYTWPAITEWGEFLKASSRTGFFAITDAAVTTGSENFAFGFTSKKVMVVADVGNGADVCLDWLGGTAVCPTANTAGDDVLRPGESIVLEDFRGTSVSAIAASGTIEVTVRAWH
jgi:hypothetical protein